MLFLFRKNYYAETVPKQHVFIIEDNEDSRQFATFKILRGLPDVPPRDVLKAAGK